MPKEEIPTRFWREYETSNMLGREKKLKHIVEKIDTLFDLKDKKLRKHALSLALQGYFDDLIEFMQNIKKD